jgi:hypothetical protein
MPPFSLSGRGSERARLPDCDHFPLIPAALMIGLHFVASARALRRDASASQLTKIAISGELIQNTGFLEGLGCRQAGFRRTVISITEIWAKPFQRL